ncbi:hypothetical protein ACFU5O_08735 [Streptomyces sp. NPDC057445]|uniref:hypothetical protein n=1 Tax=Streptomyces sp. NPDC057445 TaxID=3346136 RepID=UPI0036B07A11
MKHSRSRSGHRCRPGRRALTGWASSAFSLTLLTLLSGCGGGAGAAAVPDGWDTLDTKSVTVAYPGAAGYQEQPASERSKHNAAVALKEEGGLRTGMVSVQLNFATGVDDAEEAATAAGAVIGLGATRQDTADVRLNGEESARQARRIDYEFTSSGEQRTPEKGTRMTGVMVAGVDSKGVPFLVRINTVKDALTEDEIDTFVESITVK